MDDQSGPQSHSGIDVGSLLDAISPASPSEVITIPDTELLFHGDFKRAGNDLTIKGEGGKSHTVYGYFDTDEHRALFAPNGAQLSGDVVAALAGPLAPGQYAQAGDPVSANTPIGKVATVSGTAQAVRNGVAVTLNVGDQVLKGDVIQTLSDSAVGVIFTDGTTFNLSSNARMVLNEFVYDPNGSNNAAAISLVQGTISFLAGQVAKTGDMKVGAPVATMGIRGTAVNVNISADNGATQISVMAEADNLTHTVQVFAKNADGTQGALLGTVTNNGGIFTFNPTPVGVLVQELAKDAATLQKELTIVHQVLPTQAVGQQFLQAPDQQGNTKTAQGPTGTQFVVIDQAKLHDVSLTNGSGPTTIKVTFDSGPATQHTSDGVVHVNHPPVAVGDANDTVASGIIATNTPFAGTPTAKGNLLGNDSDPDNDPIKVVSVSAVSTSLHGSLTVNSDGTYTYTLDNTDPSVKALAVGEKATDVFTYTIADFDGLTATTTLTITITGTDDAPVVDTSDKAVTVGLLERDHQSNVQEDDVKTGTIHFTDVDLTDRPTAT
ncbi:MAG: VCBS domain-containing protein, partial [Pseudolabrys sp.]|nr:VCBS domain-containing protein [Pseudolabrys sp.]